MKIQSQEIELVSVKSLINHPKNNNKHSKEQIDRLVKLIEYQGFRNPLVVQKGTNLIVAGHGRLEAAKKLGMKEVPVTYQEFDSEAQLYAYLTSDNAIHSWSELDLSMVNQEMLDLGPDFDIDMLGIKDFVIEPIEKFEPQADEDEVPEVVHPITRRGDLWILGNHRLLCGDSTMIDDVDRLMGGAKADMVFTDPPYNVNFKGALSSTSKDGRLIKMSEGYKNPSSTHREIKNDEMDTSEFMDFISEIISIISLKCIGGWYICFSSSTLDQLLTPLINNRMKWKSIIIWNKNQSPMGGGHFRRKYEPIAYGYNENNFYGKPYAEDDVWEIDRTRKNDLHPTMKPVGLVERAIEYSSRERQTVLDLFGGSGTTVIAAENKNRKAVVMELDEKYCDVIIKRWEQYTGKKAILESTGQTYEELKVERDGQ